jgi:hypothetical protein
MDTQDNQGMPLSLMTSLRKINSVVSFLQPQSTTLFFRDCGRQNKVVLIPMSELKFSVDLWGGIKTVYDRYEEGKDSLTALINFLDQQATVESEYYKKVEKFVTKTVFQEKGTIGNGLQALKSFIEAAYKQHSVLCNSLENDMIQPLVALKKQQAVEKGNFQKNITEFERGLEKGKSELQKTKQRYYKLSHEYELCNLQLDRAEKDPNAAKQKEINKLRSQKQQLRQDSESAHTLYQQQVKELRAYQAKYEEGVKKNLDAIQNLERTRIKRMKEILEVFVKSYEQFLDTYKSAIESLKKEIAKISDEEDINNFIKSNKTNQVPEEPVQYEPYVSQIDSQVNLVDNTGDVKGLKKRSASAKSFANKLFGRSDKKRTEKKEAEESSEEPVATPTEEKVEEQPKAKDKKEEKKRRGQRRKERRKRGEGGEERRNERGKRGEEIGKEGEKRGEEKRQKR